MIAFFSLLCIAASFLELRPKPPLPPGSKERAVVLSVNNDHVMGQGALLTGFQTLEVQICSGPLKDARFKGSNILRSQMDLDKLFKVGDTVLAAVYQGADPQTDTINIQDYYRLNYAMLLFGIFTVLLVIFGGMTGVKALLSFVFSCVVIWKIVVPLCLNGWNPIYIALAAVLLLTFVIIYIIAGFTRKGTTAFCGAMLGVLASCFMAMIFTGLFHINGAVMPYSQALINAGFGNLNLADIYIGAIFLASSGAVMDLAMDVAAGMHEIVEQKPEISRAGLVGCGLRIGRSVVGTMTTTLLLAYSGGYITLMMTFYAQGTLPIDFLNNPYVVSEVVKTIIGSFGLVLVAPFTALMGGIFLKSMQKRS